MAINYNLSTSLNRVKKPAGAGSLAPPKAPTVNVNPYTGSIPSTKPGGYPMGSVATSGGTRGGGGMAAAPGSQPFGGPKTVGQESSGYPDLEAMGLNIPSYMNYDKIAGNLQTGKTWDGQFLPNANPGANYNFKASPNYTAYNYQPIQSYKPFQFNTPNISNIPGQVFKQMKTQNLENAQMGLKGGLAELSQNNAARGLGGKSGVLSGQQYSMADQMQDQVAQANRELDLQQGQSQLDVAKQMAQMKMDTQNQQAAQNLSGAQFNSANNQWLQGNQANERMNAANFNNQNSQWLQNSAAANQLAMDQQRLANRSQLANESNQNLQNLSGIQQNASANAMIPYNMMMDLYKTDTGVPFSMGGGSSGILGGLLQTGGELGSAAIKTGKCLPLGTPIELEDGSTKPVEEVRVGDQVKGGKVTKLFSRVRDENHWFTNHYFKNGSVVTMTFGHPYFDELERTSPNYDEKSICTCDILTDSGFYYVNGVKLGSTLS